MKIQIPRPGGTLETALLLLVACCLSVGQGQDASWDLLNYHLYDAFSFVDGRFARDLYPVGVQSYFNPLLDLPYYLLSIKIIPSLPRVVAFLAGIPFGLLIVVVLRIARIVLPAATPAEAWLAPIAVAIGISGTGAWSEIGTTYGDIPIAVLALVGLLLPLSLLADQATTRDDKWNRAMLAAGLLVGCATGLKPTASIFVPGVLLGPTLASGSMRRGCSGAVLFCIGLAVGFALAYGWWGIMLFHRFGNPCFPLLNHFFASPWLPSESFTDRRFLPRDLWQALFYPFYWLSSRRFIVTEVAVRDPRFALAYLALMAVAITAFARRWFGARDTVGCTLQPPAVALVIFMAVAYVAWEATFSILRYALGLEALTGIVIVLALRVAATYQPWTRLSVARLPVTCALLLLLVVAASTRPGLGRLKHYGDSVFDIVAPAIPDHAIVILADRPVGFIAPFLRGRDISFVGIVDLPRPSRLGDEIQRRVGSAALVLVLINQPADFYTTVLRSYGRAIDPASCQHINNPFDRQPVLCNTVAAVEP